MDDRELLRAYVERRSDQAFAELVKRHVNMVYATALRLVRETHLAQDVSQSVFIELAQKARAVREGNALSGWLYRTACCVAANTVRKESRRRQRENAAMNRAHLDTADDPSAVAPLLDEAMEQLNDVEQNAIVLRFFEGKSLREVGRALAITEDAAQKRISRAVQKLRTHFLRRGITVSSGVILAAIATQSVQAAPAGFAASLTGASLGAVSGATSTGLTTIVETFLMTKAKTTIVAAVLVAATGTAVFEAQRASTLQKEVTGLQRRHAEEIQQLKERLVTASSIAHAAATEKTPLTAVEIEARIQTIARRSNWRRYTEWGDFVRSLTSRDIPRALAGVEHIGESQLRELFRGVLLEHWARSDPRAAMAYAQSIKDESSPHWTVCKVLRVWAEDNPPSARAWVQQLPKGTLQRAALHTIIAPSVSEDAQATCDLIQSLDAWKTIPAAAMFESWARTDPAAAIAKAIELPFERVRKEALGTIATTWAAVDAKAAMAWAESLPAGSEREDVVPNILHSWSFSEPKQAVAYALNLPAGPRREETLSQVVRTWANNDPEAVFAWSQSLADGPGRQEVIHWALLNLAQRSPQDALAASHSLSGQDRNNAITGLGGILAANDPNGAVEHSLQLAEGADRNNYVVGVAGAFAVTSPSTAAQLVASLPATEARDRVVRQIVSTWARLDPTATAAWVESFPEGKLRNDALGQLAYKWTREDPSAALEWMQSLPNDQSREKAFQGYVARISSQTPETAAPLAEAISDPARRNTMIELVARDWIKKDRKAAASWLEHTTLPNDRKLRLLEEW